MGENKKSKITRERLIFAGMNELRASGVKNFSMRSVARECGLSCATPYIYFENSNDFIYEIFKFISREFEKNRDEIINKNKDKDPREKLLLICRENIRFYIEYPLFLSIIIEMNEYVSDEFPLLKGGFSAATGDILNEYAEVAGWSDEQVKIKIFALRAITYSSAFLFITGQSEFNEESIRTVNYFLERELDLP